jgi:hypothetical protein
LRIGRIERVVIDPVFMIASSPFIALFDQKEHIRQRAGVTVVRELIFPSGVICDSGAAVKSERCFSGFLSGPHGCRRMIVNFLCLGFRFFV